MSHVLCKTKTKQLLSKVRTILYTRSRDKCFPRVFITDGSTIWTLSTEGNFTRSFPKLDTSFDSAIPLAKIYFTLIRLHVWNNGCVRVLTVALFVKASQRFETPEHHEGAGRVKENPRDGGAWWLPSMGSHRVGHDWSDLAAAAAAG